MSTGYLLYAAGLLAETDPEAAFAMAMSGLQAAGDEDERRSTG